MNSVIANLSLPIVGKRKGLRMFKPDNLTRHEKLSDELFGYAISKWDMNKIHKERIAKVIFLDSNYAIIGAEDLNKGKNMSLKNIRGGINFHESAIIAVVENSTSPDFSPVRENNDRLKQFKMEAKEINSRLVEYMIFSDRGFFSYAKNGLV